MDIRIFCSRVYENFFYPPIKSFDFLFFFSLSFVHSDYDNDDFLTHQNLAQFNQTYHYIKDVRVMYERVSFTLY